jgi:hypothetical protein
MPISSPSTLALLQPSPMSVLIQHGLPLLYNHLLFFPFECSLAPNHTWKLVSATLVSNLEPAHLILQRINKYRPRHHDTTVHLVSQFTSPGPSASSHAPNPHNATLPSPDFRAKSHHQSNRPRASPPSHRVPTIVPASTETHTYSR